MPTDLAGILAIPAFSRALAALVASGLAFPALGTFILCLEMVPARFAVMHVALLGAALGLMLGIEPLTAALVAATASGLVIARTSERSSLSASGPLALVMTVSLGLAFLIFYKTQVQAIQAFNLLWGNILALTNAEVAISIITAVVLTALTLVFFRDIRAVLYDRDLARASGRPARLVYYGLVLGICLGVGVAMRLTGALMVDAATVLPALAARNLGHGLKGTLAWGAGFGLLANLSGFALALAFDLPVSPAVIVVGALLVAATGGWAAWRLRRGNTQRITSSSLVQGQEFSQKGHGDRKKDEEQRPLS